jgi:hypothetical protein
MLLFLRLLSLGEERTGSERLGEELVYVIQPVEKLEGSAVWRKVLFHVKIIAKCARELVREPSFWH